MRELAGLRVDPFRREVHRDGRYVALTRKQFAVLEVLVGAEGGVVSAEDVTGPYDVIARAEAADVDELGRMIVSRLQMIEGITRTLTCPVVNLE